MTKQVRMDPLFCGTSILTCQLFRGLLVILLFFLFSDCHVICDMNFPMTCYREVNRCADVLARKGAEQDIDFLSFLLVFSFVMACQNSKPRRIKLFTKHLCRHYY